ncbi:MAG: RimJ/RimL family protein N-acetyltransferase [Planctomycetota bacterium]|jgi:RimJ/RimL family protein N-acetyltransferase/catechol 2,3-dioxygenase-like lactoylglutathione lyase family enzyme
MSSHESAPEVFLTTERLEMHPLAPMHFDAWQDLNEDPEVMRFLPGTSTDRAANEEWFLKRIAQQADAMPLGIHALLERSGVVVGFVMLKLDRTFVNDTEVGWRLRRDRWGRGYATESAQALVNYGFEVLGRPRLISTCLAGNEPSQAVAKRLGFEHFITFTYGADLLPDWGLQEREGRLFVLTREAWEQHQTMGFPSGVPRAIHHINVIMSADGAELARSFYGGILGLPERKKPASLRKNGGMWFEAGATRIHLSLEDGYRGSKKTHSAFLVDDLEVLISRTQSAGLEVMRDANLPGVSRCFILDPFGNRLELMQS